MDGKTTDIGYGKTVGTKDSGLTDIGYGKTVVD